MNNTVETLRKNKYKVRVIHRRYYKKDNVSLLLSEKDYAATKEHCPGFELQLKGGLTIVNVRTPDGQEKNGVSICHGIDNFCRKTGLNIAISRALA